MRTNIQSGFRRRAPRIIEKEFNKYADWAARDGSYDHLRVVPSVLTEIIDDDVSADDMIDWMKQRMKIFARLQRNFLRHRHMHDLPFPTQYRPAQPGSTAGANPTGLISPGQSLGSSPSLMVKMSALDDDDDLVTPTKGQTGTKRGFPFQTPPMTDVDELSEPASDLPSKRQKTAPSHNDGSSQKAVKFAPPTVIGHSDYPYQRPNRQTPPVIYGLFILKTTVFLLTMDSGKGDNGYVSFHLDLDFEDEHQSVWNALTVAMVICLARDELLPRVGDFFPKPARRDSGDPDA